MRIRFRSILFVIAAALAVFASGAPAVAQATDSIDLTLIITEPDAPKTHAEIFAELKERIEQRRPALLLCTIQFTPRRNLATLLYFSVFSNWLRNPDHLQSFKAEGSVSYLLKRMEHLYLRKPKYAKRVEFDLEINESLDTVNIKAVFEFQPSNRKAQKSCLSFIRQLERHLKRIKRGADFVVIEMVDD